VKYRQLGNTDIRVSEIGFGCGGTAGLMVNGSFEEQLAAISRAIELGINYFDESPDYGDGTSESNLGRVLKELGIRPYITTKVEVRAENLEDIAGHVERSLEASLERLGVDYVDIVQIHNGPTAYRPELSGRDYRILALEDYLRKDGALEGLQRIQKAGKTRYIGFICRGNDAEPVRRLIDTGAFSLINIVYTLLNPTAVGTPARGMEVDVDWGQVIPYAYQHGVGSAIYSPLAGGLLSDNMLSGGEPHPLSGAARRGGGTAGAGEARQRQLRRARTLQFLSSGEEQSLAQAAIRFILMQPGVSTVLGGFSDVKQLEEIAAASGAEPLNEEKMARIEMVWRGNFGG
jgi:L-glyceraldehyde 3-phosphate reductase